jgi:hypothetical protein
LSILQITSPIAVELVIISIDLNVLARSPPGTTVAGLWLIPTLNPVGHQFTKFMVFFDLIVATAALTSLGTTSPLYIRQQAMYFPAVGEQPTIIFAGSKTAEESSYVVKVS